MLGHDYCGSCKYLAAKCVALSDILDVRHRTADPQCHEMYFLPGTWVNNTLLWVLLCCDGHTAVTTLIAILAIFIVSSPYVDSISSLHLSRFFWQTFSLLTFWEPKALVIKPVGVKSNVGSQTNQLLSQLLRDHILHKQALTDGLAFASYGFCGNNKKLSRFVSLKI